MQRHNQLVMLGRDLDGAARHERPRIALGKHEFGPALQGHEQQEGDGNRIPGGGVQIIPPGGQAASVTVEIVKPGPSASSNAVSGTLAASTRSSTNITV